MLEAREKAAEENVLAGISNRIRAGSKAGDRAIESEKVSAVRQTFFLVFKVETFRLSSTKTYAAHSLNGIFLRIVVLRAWWWLVWRPTAAPGWLECHRRRFERPRRDRIVLVSVWMWDVNGEKEAAEKRRTDENAIMRQAAGTTNRCATHYARSLG